MTDEQIEQIAERAAQRAAQKVAQDHACVFPPRQRAALHRLGESLTDNNIVSLSLIAKAIDIGAATVAKWFIVVLLLVFAGICGWLFTLGILKPEIVK